MAGLESATDRIQTVLLQQLEQGGLRVQVVEGLVAGAAEQDQKLPDWIEVANRQVPLDRIHAAFTWYDNHRSAINAEIEATIQAREEFRSRWGEPPVVERLRKLTLCESGDCTHPP